MIFSSCYRTQNTQSMMLKGHKLIVYYHCLSHRICSPDLSVGLFSVVPDIAWKFAVTWEAGLVACKLIK